MAAQFEELHMLMFPLMAQGHMIPMVDIARLLAQRGAMITIVTTHGNAARFEAVLSRAVESGLRINLVRLKFPCQEAGLPEGHENLDAMTSPDLVRSFFRATFLLHQPAEKLANELNPRPNCIVSDYFLPWTINIARALDAPRISFNGANCFCLLCLKNVGNFNVREKISYRNSTLEGICAGVPLITWPLFADQFFNEKLVVQVLKIAVTLGVEEPMTWGEEEKIGVKVKRETIKSALESLMDEEDQESRERRERARKLGEMATRAVEEGGSSHNNITLFLEEIMKIGNGHQQED